MLSENLEVKITDFGLRYNPLNFFGKSFKFHWKSHLHSMGSSRSHQREEVFQEGLTEGFMIPDLLD